MKILHLLQKCYAPHCSQSQFCEKKSTSQTKSESQTNNFSNPEFIIISVKSAKDEQTKK